MKPLFVYCYLLCAPLVMIGQAPQPVLSGNVSWVMGTKKITPEILPVRSNNIKLSKTVFNDEAEPLFQRKIRAGTNILKHGPTNPDVQSLRIKGVRLGEPQVLDASPLAFRDNTEFNLSYSDMEHGFAGINTSDFAEDVNHHIWMASGKELIRYDGYTYHRYSQKTGLPDMTVESILYDDQHRLWLATDKGVYFIKADSLYSLSTPSLDFNTLYCRRVYKDEQNRIWLSTKEQGAICIEGATIKWFDKRCGLPTNYVQTTFVDKKGNIFFGLFDYGVVIIQPHRMLHLFAGSEQMQHHHILSLYENEDGIWLGGFSAGLIRMNSKDTIQYSFSGNYHERIWDIKKAPGGIWLSIYQQGLRYFSLTQKQTFVISQSKGLLNGFSCFLFEDSFQNLWISSLAFGFSRLNENNFYLSPLRNKGMRFITGFLPDKSGGKWVLSDGNNLGYQKGATYTAYTYTYPNGTNPLLFPMQGVLNDDGTLWLSSHGDGILYGKVPNLTVYHYSNFSENEIIFSIQKDYRQKVWFSTMRYGLVAYENNRFYHYSKESGLLGNEPIRLYLDATKKVLCSFRNGFQRISNEGIETFHIGGKPFTSQVNACIITREGGTLLATDEDGLFILYGGTAYQLQAQSGLSSNQIKTLIQDKEGRIWITTDKGIESFFLKGHTISNFKSYSQVNGSFLTNIGAPLLEEDGTAYWSSRNRKLVFNPLFQKAINHPPVFSLYKILKDSIELEANNPISILPNQKLTLSFTCIYWGRENNLRMNYLVISSKGDTSVRPIGNRGNVIISDRPPGKYQVLVSAKDNNQTFFSAPIQIKIRDFWYNTLLFRAIIACLLISAIVFYFRNKNASQKRINALLKKQVAEQTEQLQKEKEYLLESFKVIDKQVHEKDALIQEINHRVKNNLQYISAMVEMQMSMDSKKDAIQSLSTTSRRLTAMSLVHEMLYDKKDITGLSIRKYVNELAANLKEMAINPDHPVNFNIDVEDILVDSKTATSLGIILSELVSNSLKHAFNEIESPEVTICLTEEKEDGYLQLSVSDNGEGIKTEYEPKLGLGSRLVDIFSRQLDGEYTIDKENGYLFILRFKKPAL